MKALKICSYKQSGAHTMILSLNHFPVLKILHVTYEKPTPQRIFRALHITPIPATNTSQLCHRADEIRCFFKLQFLLWRPVQRIERVRRRIRGSKNGKNPGSGSFSLFKASKTAIITADQTRRQKPTASCQKTRGSVTPDAWKTLVGTN